MIFSIELIYWIHLQQQHTQPPVFISEVDFKLLPATKRVTEETIDWVDLLIGVVYHVDDIVPIKTKWVAQVILGLSNKDGHE